LFLTRDQVAPAVRHFSAEINHHPENLAAERELGMGLARLGDTTQAIVRLEALTKRTPTDDQSWHALAFVYSAAGRSSQAEAALRQALTLAPPRALEHRDYAVLLARSGRDREAREQYRKALALDTKDPSVWYNLGNLDRRAGDLKGALKSFRTAEARDSNFTPALLGQVTVLKELGRDREVGTIYRRWLARKPGDHETRVEAVRFFAAQGQTKTGVALAQDAVKAAPRSGDAHLVLGVALDLNGQQRAALAELRTAESLFRDQESLAQVRRVIGDLRSRAPDSLRAHFHADSVAHAAAP
jgi:Flp pilus assembly protein TadD